MATPHWVPVAALLVAATMQSPAWQADRGDGTYRNPILYADYSDPDAIRVGDDFYMISSSFTAVPGIPVLHSRDLVNPDRGIFVTTATDPRGPWSAPILVKGGKGLIDPCPLWDDDGRVYLVHAWARSRAGFANVLTLVELNRDAVKPIDEGHVVIDGNAGRTWPLAAPPTSDEFDRASLGTQWQWQANPNRSWFLLDPRPGELRLNASPSGLNLWLSPHLLLQKFPAPAFTATAAIKTDALRDDDRAGLIVFGVDYAWVGVRRTGGAVHVVAASARAAADGTLEELVTGASVPGHAVDVRASVRQGGVVAFSYSVDHRTFAPIGEPFTARPGKWVGAKVGLFAARPGIRPTGHARIDWFRIAARD